MGFPDFPEELKRAGEFHTHIGPFLVVGLRIGRAIVERLGNEPFSYRLRVNTGRVPPYSCLADGIQISTPCTTGNGGMVMGDERAMSVDARTGERGLTVALRREIFDWIENECGEEDQHAFAARIWAMPEDELLTIVDGVTNEEAGR